MKKLFTILLSFLIVIIAINIVTLSINSNEYVYINLIEKLCVLTGFGLLSSAIIYSINKK